MTVKFNTLKPFRNKKHEVKHSEDVKKVVSCCVALLTGRQVHVCLPISLRGCLEEIQHRPLPRWCLSSSLTKGLYVTYTELQNPHNQHQKPHLSHIESDHVLSREILQSKGIKKSTQHSTLYYLIPPTT